MEESVSQNKEILEISNNKDSAKDVVENRSPSKAAPIREILEEDDSTQVPVETKTKKVTAKKTTANKSASESKDK